MASLPNVEGQQNYRTRRWDALVIGSGTSATIAAIRIGMAGHSVLIVQEDPPRSEFAGLREPFFLGSGEKNGPLDLCLREVSLPLIERRRFVQQSLAFQVCGPKLRLDVGDANRSGDELVTWGLAKPDTAHPLVRALADAAEVERQMMLDAPLVRASRKLVRPRGAPGSHIRGLPAEAADASPELTAVLDAQVRALSNLASASPSPEAQARLLGATLTGGVYVADRPPWLTGLLRKRLQAVYVETRDLKEPFRLVSASGHAGITVESTRELMLARALVVTAPRCALELGSGKHEVPDLFRGSDRFRRRIAVHLKVQRRVLPEAMCARVVLLPERAGEELVTLTVYDTAGSPERVDCVARIVVEPEASIEEAERNVEERVRALLPFATPEDVTRCAVERPRWDDDGWLEDPAAGASWPGELDIQVSSRPRIYHMRRAGVGGLGFEGDLLLGWRAGDAIAAELS